MGKFYMILFFLVLSRAASSQGHFKTLVPQQPVVAGESFQVQYIIQETGKAVNFKAPVFKYFRFVSGPNQYTGTVATSQGEKPLRNFVYTLEALKPGRFVIPGAEVTLDGKTVKSNDVVIDVISEQQSVKLNNRKTSAVNSDYLLRPGEDPYEKIRQNLFLKLVVNRTSCYAGEPVLAVFKLYSRLQSKSDIIKNPGFYGFTVYDMVNLADKEVTTEELNGKVFDVHTIRKVQLFPLQAGRFTIDAMEVKNKVEFSRNVVYKKAEQEIAEGMMGNNDEEEGAGDIEIFENHISTEPVTIQIKPVPEKNKPGSFNGAVGDFVIAAALDRDSFAKNEEGFFEITITGSGNFTQLNAPAVVWPSGMEGFEPVIKDSLDKTQFPVAGRRTFRYAFISSGAGQYQIQPVSFSFFNPGKKIYKTVSTNSTSIKISNEEKRNMIAGPQKVSIADTNARASRVAAGVVILLVIIVLIYWVMYTKKPAPVVEQDKTEWLTISEGISPPGRSNDFSDKEFCAWLQQFIWKTLGSRFSLEGSGVHKDILFSRLRQERVGDEIVSNLKKILTECELEIFTGAAHTINRDKMLAEAKEVLEAINQALL